MADDPQGGDDYELPPGPFVKIYGSIVLSSIWLESESTRLLWITMLAMADQNGDVRASVRGLAHTARISDDACARALAILEAPDPDSRDKRNEGRRIVAVAGGWHIRNFRRYREMRTPDQVKTAERVRRHRERKQGDPLPPVTGVTVTPEVEGEVEVELKPVVVEGSAVTRNVTPAVRLCRMLNRGMQDNPQIGERYNPVVPTSGMTLEAVEKLQAAGVPLDFAEGWVYTLACAYKPRKLGDQIGSLAYLVPAVVKEWEGTTARVDALEAPSPAVTRSATDATSSTSPAKTSGNGTYTLRAGEIIRLIRDYRPPPVPERKQEYEDIGGRLYLKGAEPLPPPPPPTWRAELNTAELRAVDAIGVDRIRGEDKPGVVLAQLSKAIGEAARS